MNSKLKDIDQQLLKGQGIKVKYRKCFNNFHLQNNEVRWRSGDDSRSSDGCRVSDGQKHQVATLHVVAGTSRRHLT